MYCKQRRCQIFTNEAFTGSYISTCFIRITKWKWEHWHRYSQRSRSLGQSAQKSPQTPDGCYNAFKLPVSCNFTYWHHSFTIRLFCWQTVKQSNKCITVHRPYMHCLVLLILYFFLFTGSSTMALTLLYFDKVWLAVGLLMWPRPTVRLMKGFILMQASWIHV